MKVICINKVYVYGVPIDIYDIGQTYDAKYLYDSVVISDNEIMEYEWCVYIVPHNHYQFTDEEFNEYFIDVSKLRDEKIKILVS